MAKHSDPLRRKHSQVCHVLDVSETTFRSVVAGLFSVDMIDISTKSAVLRKMGHEGADKLMDMLALKVDAKPERLSIIVEVMMQEEALRDVLKDLAGGKIPSTNSRETNSSPADTITATLNPTQLSSPPLQPNPPPSIPLPSKRDLNKDDLYQLRRLIDKSIEQVYARLESAIGGSLPELVRILFEDGLVSKELISLPNYDDMMKSFASTMDWDTNVEDLEKDFTKFIRALDKIGGPARKAGEKISSDLKTSVKEKFDFDFKTM